MYNQNDNVWICATGAISAIGNNTQDNFNALVKENTGISYSSYLKSVHKDIFPVGEVKLSNEELASIANMKPNLPRTAYLSAIALNEAIIQLKNQVQDNFFLETKTAFISGNTIGGMDLSEHFFESFLQNKMQGKLRDVMYHECGAITELVAQHAGINGITTTISTACSSSANSIIYGARLIKHNMADVVFAGGCDALCKFTLNGFNTLMILDKEACKPFDENRMGLNLGEGAAYIALVSDSIKEKYNLQPIAKLTGYANANDAFHQTASSAEGNGNYYAMKGALEMSKLKNTEIDYINAHGTGTGNNDISEGKAIERLFENNIPDVSSTKAYTGHTLGACGALEAVYACMSIKHGIVYPSLRIQIPIQDLNFTATQQLKKKEVSHVMSNSFGFGGNCSSLIFSKSHNV